ncbi:thioredoxin family protein [Flavobacterium sp.]|uniref:TlpA family protein disulfide reductase n=1 Tax=Flavobacterium sp. TaxID=239 RepID=UPI00286A8F6C|nr:thioredoxin family protein [Flavobacterium sp.]
MHALKFILLLLTTVTVAQTKFTIKGHFNATANKEITLKGFTAQESFPLDKTTTDSNGNFAITYSADYIGAALLEITKGKKVIVLLNHENYELQWDDMNTSKSMKFINSPENSTFDKGLTLYQNTQEKKSGITYLIPFYENEPQKSSFFKTELNQLNAVIPNYLNSLSDKTYASYYLKIRTLIADFPLSTKRYPERIPELEKQCTDLNFNDQRLIHSGLYYELLDTYVATLEHYGEKKAQHLNAGIDAILASLKSNPDLKQNVAEHLFNQLEKRSLFESSQYIALAMLTDNTCQLDDKHKALFEQYRKMGNGKTAPDISFFNEHKSSLYDLKNKYKLVVFGASWCPKCVEEIPKLKTFYDRWVKQYNLEIVFISLDDQKKDYDNFIKDFPWISSCDFNKWETQAAKDYCVFGTPTMYLLDSKNTIQIKPISAEQVNAWLQLHQ